MDDLRTKKMLRRQLPSGLSSCVRGCGSTRRDAEAGKLLAPVNNSSALPNSLQQGIWQGIFEKSWNRAMRT